MEDIWIYVIGGIVAIAFIAIIRGFATRYETKKRAAATAEFKAMSDFDPSKVHAFGKDAVAYDETRNHLAWRSGSEQPMLLSPSKVGSWYLGEVEQSFFALDENLNVGSRETYTQYLLLYSPEGALIRKLGFVHAEECASWSVPLDKVLGEATRRDTP